MSVALIDSENEELLSIEEQYYRAALRTALLIEPNIDKEKEIRNREFHCNPIIKMNEKSKVVWNQWVRFFLITIDEAYHFSINFGLDGPLHIKNAYRDSTGYEIDLRIYD